MIQRIFFDPKSIFIPKIFLSQTTNFERISLTQKILWGPRNDIDPKITFDPKNSISAQNRRLMAIRGIFQKMPTAPLFLMFLITDFCRKINQIEEEI